MKIEFDPTLVERTVMHAIYGNRSMEAELHGSLESFYQMPSGRLREEGFRSVYAEWFKRLGFGKTFDRLLEEQPLIAREIGRCLIREAAGSRSESAEFLARPGSADGRMEYRALIVQATPRSLAEPDRWIPFMRRELFHVADMLDSEFAYERSEIDGLPAKQNLVRDRYRVLWDLYIESRLELMGKGDEQASIRVHKMFARVFGYDSTNTIPAVMRRFDTGGAITHTCLWAWANSPELLFGASTDPKPRKSGTPGSMCPICSFPTFDWYHFNDPINEARLVGYFYQSRPDWSVAEGLCRQCAEMILSNSGSCEAVGR